MNALTRSVSFLPRSAFMARRMQSSATTAVMDKTAVKLRTVWYSDRGAYPVMGCLAFAMVFCTWYGLHNLLTSPDIRINKDKRYSPVRTWEKGQWS